MIKHNSTLHVLSIAAALLLAAITDAGAQVGKSLGLLDANTATPAQIAAVPGLDAAHAKWIVDNRPFEGIKQIDDHLKATLDSAKRIAIYQKVFLPVNLNVQVPQEIRMIPVPWRNLEHEFDEYKPYAALAVWHREMDKYLDEPMLGTLQQYVFVPMNVNTATDADLMTIPGIKPAELAALKAGRPWADVARLRTELGKVMGGDKQATRITRYLQLR